MHTLVEKPKVTQQTEHDRSGLPDRGGFRQSRSGYSMPPQGSVEGSRITQRHPWMGTQSIHGQEASAPRMTGLARDFSRTPLHSPDPQQPRWRGAGDLPAPANPLPALETAPAQTGPAEPSAETTPPATAAPAAAGTLRWQFIPQHRWDALWYFCGEHPSGFSTTATLRAEGYTNPNNVEWFVRQGADKVYAPGGFTGPEIVLHSSEGSRRADDVQIEVQERQPGGGLSSYQGGLTVRKPYRLRQEWTSDHTTCPDPSLVPSPAIWSEIHYRIIDNVGGTIIGATVNERFPSPPVNDQPNNWSSAPTTSSQNWPNTNGTFTDNLYMCGGTPPPVDAQQQQLGG